MIKRFGFHFLTPFIMMILSQALQAQEIKKGINITGLEKVWESPELNSKQLIRQIKSAKKQGFGPVRIPLAVDLLLATNPVFLKELRSVVSFAKRNEIDLVLAYFDHQLSNANAESKQEELVANWLKILNQLDWSSAHFFIELANEPNLSPEIWERIWPEMVSKLSESYPELSIVVGATNFNSLFELSRTNPPKFENVIYTFHYYEPYLFTHQGTEWTGDQNATLGIPYPYASGKMPRLSSKAKGTSGEINYRDYNLTGNRDAVLDKIGQIANWAKQNKVRLWCTEYGATVNAAPEFRKAYLEDVSRVLESFQILGFVWEWQGNFGVEELIKHD